MKALMHVTGYLGGLVYYADYLLCAGLLPLLLSVSVIHTASYKLSLARRTTAHLIATIGYGP